MAERTGARPRRGGGAPQARFAAAGRADGQDGQWEVVDRQTGTAPVGGKVLPVRRAAAGLNRAPS
jgi:hypothetical protein